mmetsp:Transcript_37265/g.55544  ORF Transcript_37265/g.55544 Transcript_37265/m.55544 type:complete len:80 (+) Transcript_37265:864-1103(+)
MGYGASSRHSRMEGIDGCVIWRSSRECDDQDEQKVMRQIEERCVKQERTSENRLLRCAFVCSCEDLRKTGNDETSMDSF